MHKDNARNHVVTLKGIDVYSIAWYTIMGVSKTSYFEHQVYVDQGIRIDHHRNLGRKKPQTHNVQAKATLGCLFRDIADQMPHKSKTFDNGKKDIVLMSLLTS